MRARGMEGFFGGVWWVGGWGGFSCGFGGALGYWVVLAVIVGVRRD